MTVEESVFAWLAADPAVAAIVNRSSADIMRMALDRVGPDISDSGAQAYGRVVEVDAWMTL